MASNVATAMRSETRESSHPWYASGMALVIYIALAKLALHLYAIRGYGYFRDELYYLALADHPLSWGYVDLPPLWVALVKLIRTTLGDSLFALRLLPAVAGAAKVVMAGLLARELGGRRIAQALAAGAVFCAAVYWGLDHLMTMNTLEPLIWTACAWIALRIAKTGKQKLWLWFGLISGLGLITKYSMAFFAAALVVAVICTPLRNSLRQRWIWIGGAIAAAIALPNFWWQASHHFPFLELMHNIRASGRDTVLSPLAFIRQQILIMNPVTAPIWIGGLGWALFSRRAKEARLFGIAFLVFFAMMLAMHGKDYYVAPAYVLMFAAGGVFIESLVHSTPSRVTLAGYALLLAGSNILIPYALPVLSEDQFLAFTHKVGLKLANSETHELNELGQLYADEHGWPEMAEQVAKAYNSLPPEERAKTYLYAMNYGQAGAIDFFGPKLGLPKSFSGHQQYWYWGPKSHKGDNLLVLGRHRIGDLPEVCEEARAVGRVGTRWSMPYEHWDIYYCRGVKANLADIWDREKDWD